MAYLKEYNSTGMVRRIASYPVEIETGYLSSMGLQRHRYTNPINFDIR